MHEVKIGSLSEYIECIEKLSSYYPMGIVAENPVANPFLYRGICDTSYELLPSVFRKCIDTECGHKIDNYKYLAWTTEKSLLQSFIHEASGLLSIPTHDLKLWAEYAQHYGVPTRFLDWTENPLVALYFACKDKTELDGYVWLIHRFNYDGFFCKKANIPQNKTDYNIVQNIILDLLNGKSDIEYPLIYTPHYVDARMSAQKSYFMVWGNNEESFESMVNDEKYMMDLPETDDDGERSYGMAQDEQFIFKFFIFADRKQPILHQLNTVGINEKTLFPGLDGIGRYVERQYRFDYNESKGAF